MKRGEIWTVSGSGYSGKPRPAVIMQDDQFVTATVTICPLTSDMTEAELLRIPVFPSAENGLREPSRLMVDKLSTISRDKAGRRIGQLEAADFGALEAAIAAFLGLKIPTA